METEADLLARFPKRRPDLPESYRAIYIDHYRRNRDGATAASSIAKRMESWMHRKVAEDISDRSENTTTLEVGAGTLNHLEYEPLSARYDIVEPFMELYLDSANRNRVAHTYRDLSEIANVRYDRIISIATFEHLCELPVVVARCGLLLTERGRLRVAVPSEGTILWALGWRFTTGVEFRLQHGLDYAVLMRHEHVNTSAEVAAVLRFFFKSVRQSVLGISPALSFYQFFDCSVPEPRRCADYGGAST
jgi:hypothetical protein